MLKEVGVPAAKYRWERNMLESCLTSSFILATGSN